MANHILLPIRSEHANAIYSGTKKAELRKAFGRPGPCLVFLYEVTPVAAVTGAFVSLHQHKASASDCIRIAGSLGVSTERASVYYSNVKQGCVVEVTLAVKFTTPILLKELQQTNHYFRVPQSFCYLRKYDALAQKLIDTLSGTLGKKLKVRPTKSKNDLVAFRSLILDTVGRSYEDIDEDFLQQNLDASFEDKAAFSTSKKQVLKITANKILVGYGVVTAKKYGAVKTGPTTIVEHFRGLGLGAQIRASIENHCRKNGAKKVYCTCPSDRGPIVAYLLNAGMRLEATLRQHLASNRDELVFGKILSSDVNLANQLILPLEPSRIVKLELAVSHNSLSHIRIAGIKKLLNKVAGAWYFALNKNDIDGFLSSSIDLLEAHVEYSRKPRIFVHCMGGEKTLLGLAAVTLKRSKMAKINLFANYDSFRIAHSLIHYCLKHIIARRFYITLPVGAPLTAIALAQSGFKFEGRLQNPFGHGDHLCFGYLPKFDQQALI